MKKLNILAAVLLFPKVCLATNLVSVCDINMDNTYQFDRQKLEVTSGQKNYIITSDSGLSVNNSHISLGKKKSDQLSFISQQLRELLPKVLQREQIAAKQQLKGEMMQRITKNNSTEIDGKALERLVKKTMMKVDDLFKVNNGLIDYLPQMVDSQLEQLQQNFISSLTLLSVESTNTANQSHMDINEVSKQMTEAAHNMQALNIQICDLAKSISKGSEIVKADMSVLNSMQLVRIEQVQL